MGIHIVFHPLDLSCYVVAKIGALCLKRRLKQAEDRPTELLMSSSCSQPSFVLTPHPGVPPPVLCSSHERDVTSGLIPSETYTTSSLGMKTASKKQMSCELCTLRIECNRDS